jgi:multidrug resistance efflux pump
MEKITKREMFEAIKETFETGKCKYDAAVVTAFCDKEIASLDSKAAKAKERAAAKKAEADGLTDLVAAALTDEFQVIADIAATVAESDADATVSKVTYRLGKLVEAGKAEKTQVTIPATEGSKARKVQAYRALA